MTEPLTPIGNDVLIAREGMRTTAYYNSVGVLTICVGHTSAAGPPKVTAGMKMTEQECTELFATDILKYAKPVDDFITKPMLDHERDAFVSICYNIGESGFRSSTFAKRFNAGDKLGCAEAILWWDQPSEIIPRRKAEQSQFLTPYGVSLPKARSTDVRPIPAPDGEPGPGEPPVPTVPEVPVPCPFPGPAMEKWEIAALQTRLAWLGFTQVGPADGIFGPKTTEAIAALQKHVGIVADFGRLTAAALADEQNRVVPMKHAP